LHTCFAEADHHTAHFKVYQNVRIAKVRAELKQQESTHAAQWAAAQQDGPYEKGSHPFKEYFLLAYYLMRSELQLWGSTLPSNEESLQVFVNICEALIGELSRVLAPILADEKSKTGNPVVRKVCASHLFHGVDATGSCNDMMHDVYLCRASWCWFGWTCWRPSTTDTRSSGACGCVYCHR
jgi:hypothetical protein